MIGALWAAIKAAAIALGWMKQNADEKTGAALEQGKVATDELQAIRDDRARAANPSLAERVRDDHGIRPIG